MIARSIIAVGIIVCFCGFNKPFDEPVEKVPPVEGIRIAWDRTTLQKLSRNDANYAAYARMIRLHDGAFVCVYESDGNIECIRKDNGLSAWSKPQVVASRENRIARCVPEILEKADGSLLLSYNLRPEGNNTDTSKRFSIRVKHSSDGGRSWNSDREVYRAGHEFKNGCWEPAQIQLPSGEIQLFIANEGPYINSDEQEITVFRSADGGYSWSEGQTASFRKGYRDGMPVPLVLQNEIIFSIEDNGITLPQFKPVVIRTPLNNSWKNGPVTGDDKNRVYAFGKFNDIPGEKYAGAPYIRRLNSGEIILSYQGDENRAKNQWDLSDMIVCIGDSTGNNFNRKSLPFYFSDPAKTCLWNSITVESDSTVIALSSTNAYGTKTAVYMIRGYILKDIATRRHSPDFKGRANDLLNTSPIFIGGYGSSNARISTSWDHRMFYAVAIVNDRSVQTLTGDPEKDDGISIQLDPTNASLNFPGKGIFNFEITAGCKLKCWQGDNGKWVNWDAEGVVYDVKQLVSGGYRVQLGIPWKTLGGLPPQNTRLGFNAVLRECSSDPNTGYNESISGNVKDKPYTWCTLKLIK